MVANSPTPSEKAPPGAAASSRLQHATVSLRRDLMVTRQLLNSGPRYVVHDPVAFKNHVLTPLEYKILCALVAHRTLGQTLERLVRDGALTSDDSEEFYGFVVALHGLGLLVVPGMPVEAIWRRHVERRERRNGGWLRILMSLRVPLGNPDRHLQRLLPFVRWLFSTPGVLLWVLLATAAVWQCGGRVGELYGNPADLLALGNLPLLWCSLVGLKVLHELGHAFAIKRFGGAVPDFGVIFIMLTPCAYVDANASWTFANRWPRIAVGLAGMYVETLIACVFALVWAGTAPGLLHEVARNIVVLASVTTIMVNINPLVKFDGYFVFSDLVGIVNLQERASRHLRSAVERVLLGLPRPAETLTRRERLLVWGYAPAALCYRVSLAIGITAMMMMHWPAMGLALGTVFGWMLIVDPIRRLFVYLWRGERTAPVRLRARSVASAAVLGLVFAAELVPVSYSVVAQGVLDPGVRRSLRAPSSAFVATVQAADGDQVQPGRSLCHLVDPQLEERRLTIGAELTAARILLATTEGIDPVFAVTAGARVEFLEKRAAELAARAAALQVAVEATGTVVGADNIVRGQWVHQGEELMQVHSDHRFVRVVLTDHDVTRARLQVGTEVELRWTCDPLHSTHGTVREIRRSASRHRVPMELTVAAGGQIQVRTNGSEAEADQPYLHVFLAVDSIPLPRQGSGLTTVVQFPAREETLGHWVRRRLLNFVNNWRLS